MGRLDGGSVSQEAQRHGGQELVQRLTFQGSLGHLAAEPALGGALHHAGGEIVQLPAFADGGLWRKRLAQHSL